MDMSNFENLNLALKQREDDLCEGIAQNCSDKLSFLINEDVKKMHTAVAEVSEKINLCNESISQAAKTAKIMLTDVNSCSTDFDGIKTALSTVNADISKECAAMNTSVASLKAAIEAGQNDMINFTGVVQGIAEKCSDAVDNSIKNLETVNNNLNVLADKIDLCRKSWDQSAEDQRAKANELSGVIVAASERISKQSEGTASALNKASDLAGNISKTAERIISTQEKVFESLDIIINTTEKIKSSSDALDQTVSQSDKAMEKFSYDLKKSSDDYVSTINNSITKLSNLNNVLSVYSADITEATKEWRTESENLYNEMSDKLEEQNKNFEEFVFENEQKIKSYTEQYSTSLHEINNKLQNSNSEISAEVADLKESVGNMNMKMKGFALAGIAAACAVFVMQIISFFV